MPGGKFIVHLVSKCSYGPTNFRSKFGYKGKNIHNRYLETITTTKIRRNEHKFYMESINFIVSLANDCGFSVLYTYRYQDEYIYVFQK